MSHSNSFNASTQGISADVRHATGDFREIARGPLNTAQLMALLSQAQGLVSPAPDREDVCVPQVHVQGPGGRFVFYCDGGHLFSYEIDAAVNSMEAMQYITAQRALPTATPPPPAPSGGAVVARGLMGALVAGVILLAGLGGGVAIIRNTEEQIYQFSGIFLMIVACTFAIGIFRAIRGRTRRQAATEHAEHTARRAAIAAEHAMNPIASAQGPAQAPHFVAPPVAQQAQAAQHAGGGQAHPTALALAFQSGSLAGQIVPLPRANLIRIGRAPESEIRLHPQHDVAASGHHAEIRLEADGQLYLHDTGSSGGTYVDGARVDAAPLRAGQTLTFGANGPCARVIEPAIPKTIIGG